MKVEINDGIKRLFPLIKIDKATGNHYSMFPCEPSCKIVDFYWFFQAPLIRFKFNLNKAQECIDEDCERG